MTAPIWYTQPGFLGTFSQRTSQSIPITVLGTTSTFSIISGNLPSGLVLNLQTTSTSVLTTDPDTGVLYNATATTCFIVGDGTSVPDVTTSKFVVRAKNSSGISDRTFSIDIVGDVAPLWITDGGMLPIGTTGEHFTVNNESVSYQLVAEANVLLNNQQMIYYIADGDGQLPPGLTLSENGIISGIVKENLSIEQSAYISGYDSDYYDAYPYDVISKTGDVTTTPRFYTKIYQFYVTVSDGFNSSRRLFSIQLFDANSLRADTSYITADADYFANDGYLFAPNWLSPANLGIRRAGNYQIVELKIYDPFPSTGPVSFEWDSISINPEIRGVADSAIDPDTGKQTQNLAGSSILYLKNITTLPQMGQYFRLDSYVSGADSTEYEIVSVTDTGNNTCYLTFQYNPTLSNGQVIYQTTLKARITDQTNLFFGSKSVHPEGFSLDFTSGDLYGQIPYLPSYNLTYKFTVRMTKTDTSSGNLVKSDRVFTLTLKGNIDSTLEWITGDSPGALHPGYQSELYIQAKHTDNAVDIQYNLVGGTLPNGLELKRDGTIVGKIPYGGLTYIDYTSSVPFTIDGGATTIDRQASFTVTANDVYRLSALTKTFYIELEDNKNNTQFSNVYVRPFLSKSMRQTYRDFVLDRTLFSPSTIYRPSDPAFGIQNQIRMTIEFGIQRLQLADYVACLQEYFYNKRFYFGDVKSVLAKDENGNSVYELVYVDIIDDMENKAGKSPDHVTVLVNQQLQDVFTSSLDNWQARLEGVTLNGDTISTDEYLRPRYMRTIQTDGQPLGFIKAVPICYVKPGYGATTVEKINLTGFDFKLIDFEVDRLIIDQTIDYTSDKYLKFPVTSATFIPDGTQPLDPLAGPDGIILVAEDGTDLFTEGDIVK
jgi:hypothetical protein